jgi:hypothetical protein
MITVRCWKAPLSDAENPFEQSGPPLFNTVRPHSSLGYLTPAAFAAKVETNDATIPQATGRIAAVLGASALRPVAQPSRKGQTKAAIGVVVSS